MGSITAACDGDDDKKDTDSGTEEEEGGTKNDSGMGGDAGRDGGVDAGRDAGGPPVKPDAGPIDPIVPGEMAPTLPDGGLAYYDDDFGPRVLIKGRDPNGDVMNYTMSFFNRDDAGTLTPVAIDPDGTLGGPEDKPPSATFTAPLRPTPNEAGFFAQLEQTTDFVALVNAISLYVSDSGGRQSNTLTVNKMAAPTRAAGASCDPFGFNRCNGPTLVCARVGQTTNFSCQQISTARSAACSAALTLSPPATTTVYGSLTTASLWDSPNGCSNGNPKRKPDSVVKLHLSTPAAKVTLSTDNAWTDISDTVLYKLEGSCSADAPMCPVDPPCSFCAEDISDSNRRSKLELTNLAAGDYYFVVDSFPTTEASGTNYELSVVVE